MDSLRAFAEAVEAFALRLAAVDWRLLAVAAGFRVLNLALRARGWQNILRAALPGQRVRYRTTFAAHCAGTGVNAVVPARVGDLVKILIVRRGVPDAPYPLLVGSLVAETFFDMFMASALIAWVLYTGILPGLRLPDIPAFDLSLAFRHPWITAGLLVALIVVGLLTARRVQRFWRTFGQGLAILRTPVRYLRTVAVYHAMGWGCRLGAAYFFLGAFGIPQSLRNALIVLVAASLGSLFPATPAGLGPKQALAVVMLAGEAGRSAVLAFSAGMELANAAVNVALGAVCIALTLRSLRLREVIGRAKAERDEGAADAGPDPSA